MNISVYLRDKVAQRLQEVADKEGVSRNHLVTEAIELLLEEKESSSWGEEVINWQGCPDFELRDKPSANI